MDRTLFTFIWKHSKREQFTLLLVTLITFPFLYATLELPKRIINDAIGAEKAVLDVFGYELSQTQFLLALCVGYLLAVLCHGLLKMRLNTMKGITSERLLRRFRYSLISRMMRFPRSYFQQTSQGELVAMVTSEAEPMGGLMGDAVAQPLFQAGQMLLIVTFLFLQSVWFGLAGIALIPLQAWLIPMIQRQINQLNKQRITQVRALASEIGESAAGITDLRTNGGVRYRLAGFTDRLGQLFEIRYKIYNKKFFMKFLNNFITQLTPFFFYAVGGYLAIQGEITVGALVAALAAYKDLSNPWKELLTYYNQVQDMSLRWEIVVDRFNPKGIIDETLFEGEPSSMPHLRGTIELDHVTVRNASGNPVLEDINLTIPSGARVAIKVPNGTERTALAELLTREILPVRGNVRVDGQKLSELHQAVIAARIGYAHSRPYLFDGTLGSNLMMPLMTSPKTVLWDPSRRDRFTNEAARSGNSADSLRADWVDPALADLKDGDDIRSWWFELVQAMGIDEFMFQRMLTSRVDPKMHPELAKAVVGLRDEVFDRLKAKGLDKAINRFDPDKFNPSVPLGGNLLFAAPARELSPEELVAEKSFLALIMEQGLAEEGIAISQTVVETLHQTFGRDGTNHPLFTALGVEETLYEQLVDIAARRREVGDKALNAEEFALFLTVPFAFTAEQIGPAFPDSFKQEILNIRRTKAAELRERSGDLFVPLAPENYLPRLTLMENLMYGLVSAMAGAKAEKVREVISDLLTEKGLRRLVAETIFDIPAGLAGSQLPPVFQERAAFSRAGIKKPDILVLDKALASHDADSRRKTRTALRKLMPDTTLIFMEDNFENPSEYDLFVEIKNGRIDGIQKQEIDLLPDGGSDDLRSKMREISRTETFAKLDVRNQRLLAFAARWYTAPAGQKIFSKGDVADAAWLCVKGSARMFFDDGEGARRVVSTVLPGRLIGDLAVLLDETRQVDLIAEEETVFLRIGAREFKAVIESDTTALLTLLQTVGGHLQGAAELLAKAQVDVPQDFGDPEPEAT
ncbi:ABC transporter transmembrane domain-containing protein [Ascidiaceihabitans sp.]|uniref:ABC transporter transmembrane domain-containing protein n=1 Tax=Ascidiaceihabitans sp. TaxID=1872644 RepID=UPI0032979E2B